MRATISGYAQMEVSLTEDDVRSLEISKECVGMVWRTTGETLPLRLYIKEAGWRAQGIPADSPWEEKESYEIDMPPGSLEVIKQRRTTGSGRPTIDLRKVYISLEGVYD